MSNETAFLQAIRAKLHDDLPRLVYADWLEERGDPRHEFLRLECELVRTWSHTTPRPDLFARLVALRAQFDSDWLAQVRRCTTPTPPVDVAEIIPDLKSMAQTTVRLHPRPGEAPIDASKIGGKFLWPAKEDWPHCAEHDCPFVCALQLWKEDVPEVGFKPGTDLFQLLWCPHNHGPGYCPDVKACWWTRASIRKATEVPEPPTPAYDEILHLPQPCLIYPEQIVEYPDPCELGLDEKYRSITTAPAMIEATAWASRLASSRWPGPDMVIDMYQTWLSAAAGTKVGGYPDWIHSPEYPPCSCGGVMELLVQFSSCEYNGGTLGRWLPIQDREVLGLDYNAGRPVREAMGLMFGDVGKVYVFHCPTCEARPMRAFMQG